MTTSGIPETTDGEERRKAFEAVLDGVRFPVTRDQLVAWAEAGDARAAVVTDLRSLEDLEFGDLGELLAALGIGVGRSIDVGTVPPGQTVGDPLQGLNRNQAAPVRPPAREQD